MRGSKRITALRGWGGAADRNREQGGHGQTEREPLWASATPRLTQPGCLQAPAPCATYERLRRTIAERMLMSHVYQPLMLMELLSRRSPAPAQDVARRILGEDVTQIDDTSERVKRMVGRVLTSNGITRCEKGTVALDGGEELSAA